MQNITKYILAILMLSQGYSTLTAQTIVPTQTDQILLPDNGTPGKADPGDKIRYKVTIQNTHPTTPATGVQLNVAPDARTTLDMMSFHTTPLAFPDAFSCIGNVGITVPDGASDLLGNDYDDAPAGLTATAGTFNTTAGGTITIAANGSFSYNPPRGFEGADTYQYTLNDGNDVDGMGPIPGTDLGTVTFNVSGIIWFINNNAGACASSCDDRLSNPYTSLAAFNTTNDGIGNNPANNDNIFIYESAAAYTGGIVLRSGQKLFGQDASATLASLTGLTLPMFSNALPVTNSANGTVVTITNGAGNGITLASSNTIRGLEVGAVTGGVKIFGNGFGTLTVGNTTTPDVVLSGAGQALNLTTGSLAATSAFTSVATTGSPTQGIIFTGVGGTVAFGSTTVSGSTTQGILIGTTTANINFGNTSVTGGTDAVSLQNNSAGTRTFGTLTISGNSAVGFLHAVGGGTTTVTGATTITNPAGTGIDIQSSTTLVTFANTTVNKGASSGVGVNLGGAMTGNSGGVTFANLTITTNSGNAFVATEQVGTITATSGTISATGGIAIFISKMAIPFTPLAMTLGNVSSTNSPDQGIRVFRVSGTLTATGGAISNPVFTAISFQNSSTTTFTYNGSVSKANNNAGAIVVGNITSGTVNFNGQITQNAGVVNVSNIALFSNTGATINFGNTSGTSAITNQSGNGFDFIGGGTLNITGNNYVVNTTTTGIPFNATAGTVTATGTGNTLSSISGTALNVVNATIGASGLTFQSISSGNSTAAADPANGIVLNNTGSSGGLTVTGTGAATSGGTIQNCTGAGMALTSTAKVNLAYMNIQGSGDDGINGSGVTDFALSDCTVTNNGNATSDEGIHFVNLSGTSSITNCSVTNNAHNNLWIYNDSGTLTALTITGSTFEGHNNAGANGNHGLLFDVLGSAVVTSVNITGSTFRNNKVIGMQVLTGDNSTISGFTVSGCTFSDTGTGNSQEVSADFSAAGTSSMTYKFLNNNITGHNSHGFNTFTSAVPGTTGTFNATISGNTVGNAAVAGSGSMIGNGLRININGDKTARVLVDNNVIRQCPNGRGIEVICRNGTGGADVTVTNNNVNTNDVSGFPLCAIFMQSNDITVPNTLRANVLNNTVPAGTAFDVLNTFIGLAETGTSTLQLVDSPPASANATAQLTSTNTGSASASAGVSLIAGPINLPPP